MDRVAVDEFFKQFVFVLVVIGRVVAFGIVGQCLPFDIGHLLVAEGGGVSSATEGGLQPFDKSHC